MIHFCNLQITQILQVLERERVTLIQYVFSFGKHENKDVLQSSCFDCFSLDNAAIEEEKRISFLLILSIFFSFLHVLLERRESDYVC